MSKSTFLGFSAVTWFAAFVLSTTVYSLLATSLYWKGHQSGSDCSVQDLISLKGSHDPSSANDHSKVTEKSSSAYLGTQTTIPETLYNVFPVLRPTKPSCVPLSSLARNCTIWGVVTTIFEPTDAVLLFAKRVANACVVVVGDRKTDGSSWQHVPENIIYVGPSEQETLCFKILQFVPWNHFGRKNIGYMYAIAAGADRIFDFDDDNVLKAGMEHVLHDAFGKCSVPQSAHLFYNPYPEMQDAFDDKGVAWPRGFPLEFIRDSSTHSQLRVSASVQQSVAVVQSLADHDPDVDAIFRLTRPLPMYFASEPSASVAIPIGTYTPWNAQATLFMRPAFFGLVLPVTVPGRVSDIWRSYITTRLLQDAGMHVVFISPIVNQHRNPHSYMVDFEEELDLYMKVIKLISVLETSSILLEAPIEDNYLMLLKALVTANIVRQTDYNLAEAWVLDLQAVGYKWPARQPRAISPHLHLLSDSKIFDGRKSSASTSLNSKIFWTSDLHDGTRIDFTTQLMQLGHRVRNMGHKGLNSPYPDFLRQMLLPSRPLSDVLHRLTGHTTPSMTDAAAREFFEYYKNDADMLATDAFMCHFPASFCEMYLPFNRSIIVSASHRVFLGRCSVAESILWIQHLRAMAAHPRRHFIFGSNRYDAEYIRHYTGLSVQVLPASSYGYQFAPYAPNRPEILLGPLQLGSCDWQCDAFDPLSQGRWVLKTAKQIYSRFNTQDIANHRAFVIVPYAVHSYGVLEVFSLSVPIFTPTIEFAIELGIFHDKNVNDGSYCGSGWQEPPADPNSPHPFSPEDRSNEAMRYWLQFADLYTFPHVQYFSSWQDLVQKLDAADFSAIHQAMAAFNSKKKALVHKKLQAIADGLAERGSIPQDWLEAIAPWGSSSRLLAV